MTRTDVFWGLTGLAVLIAYLSLSSSSDSPRPSDATDSAARQAERAPRREDRAPPASTGRAADGVAAPRDHRHCRTDPAHLTGGYAPYARAEAALNEAFHLAPKAAGPHLARARLAFVLHRFDEVEPSLARAERALVVNQDVRQAIDELRAATAFQRGDLEGAERALLRLIQDKPTVTALARLGQVRWKSGDFARADTAFVEALDRTPAAHGERRAWLNLMRGLLDLDRGRLDEALAHYRVADAAFRGWYLIEEHIAEIFAKKNDHQEARARYEALVARTDNPEFMDALADTYSALGRNEDASAMRDRARQRYEAQLARFPEAAYGHALDHFLEAGDVRRAVALAEKNVALRPNGEALAKLADVYDRAGRHRDATKTIVQALKSGWFTPDVYATAADILEGAAASQR